MTRGRRRGERGGGVGGGRKGNGEGGGGEGGEGGGRRTSEARTSVYSYYYCYILLCTYKWMYASVNPSLAERKDLMI